MNFLLRTPDSFMIIDHHPRQGIFCHPFTKDGFAKTYQVHSFSTESFSATLDSQGRMHVLTESNKNQIIYIHFDKGMPQKKFVLEDAQGQYAFKHLNLHTINGQLYLFYSVKHPTGMSRSLMYQPLDPNASTLNTLIPSLPDASVVKMLATDDTLYVLYTDFNQRYLLKLVTVTPAGLQTSVLYTSDIPIIDFNCCLSDQILHVIYIKDAYGKQQVGYLNTLHQREIKLPLAAATQVPCIFYFAGYLWVTYTYGEQLYMLLSIDQGLSFSAAVPCSLQGPFTSYTYRGIGPFDLKTTAVHATLTHALRIGIIGSLDIVGIHPDLMPTTELELLLEGVKLSAAPPSPVDAPPARSTSTPSMNIPPPLAPPTIENAENDFPSTLLEPSLSHNSSKDLKSATKAFMENISTFDATPK